MTNNSPRPSNVDCYNRKTLLYAKLLWPSSAPAILCVHGLGCSKADGVAELMESFVAHSGLNRFLLERVVFPQIKKALAAKTGPGSARHLQVLEKANPRAYYDYDFQTVEYSDRGNLPGRFLSLPAPKCFLHGSQNRHLSYLQRLRESECAVVEIPNANHFLFYHQPNHCAAALASLAQSSCSFPNPGTPIPRLASSTCTKGEI